MNKEKRVLIRILGYQVGMRVRFKGYSRDSFSIIWITGTIWSAPPTGKEGMFLIKRDDKKPYNLFPMFERDFELIGENENEEG